MQPHPTRFEGSFKLILKQNFLSLERRPRAKERNENHKQELERLHDYSQTCVRKAQNSPHCYNFGDTQGRVACAILRAYLSYFKPSFLFLQESGAFFVFFLSFCLIIGIIAELTFLRDGFLGGGFLDLSRAFCENENGDDRNENFQGRAHSHISPEEEVRNLHRNNE